MLAALVGISLPPALDFDVRSGSGMTLRLQGVPIVRGTGFTYLGPDPGRAGYVSFTNAQQVERVDNGFKVSFRSGDGKAFGTQRFSKEGNTVKLEYELGWDGPGLVRVELAAGMLWARIFQGGQLFIDQRPARSLAPTTYVGADLADRLYGESFGEAVFQSALGKVMVKGSSPSLTLYDGRGYRQSWADGKDLLWIGQRGIELRRGAPAKGEIAYTFDPPEATASKAVRSVAATQFSSVVQVRSEERPIVPRPKQALFDRSEPFLIGDELKVDVPERLVPFKKELIRQIQRWWIAPNLKAPQTNDPNIFCRVENIGLPAEGFEIRVNRKNIIVWGQDDNGLRHAMRTLGQLAFAKDGKLWFPSGTMRDWPSIGWRGVHLFGGPELRSFHPLFAERVLLPLRFNKVVLQCERTRWDSQPGIHTPLFNNKSDLIAAFEMYRSKGIEPIPLIQSLGHMEWFFGNGQNLDLAVNPLVPYTLDLSKPKAREAIEAVWAEAIEALRPKVIHMGLDEIDSRGMSKLPSETTAVWEQAVPVLGAIAVRHGVTPMFWGDQGLAPAQAIDAAHGDDPANAKRRRDALPRGAWIGDWHYKNDPFPDRFLTSLNLWKEEGFFPIASGWFNPQNIAGFTQAAYRTGGGYLQTTWAGYETTEANMHREMRQFAAYVVASDYAWSGRTNNELEYDPVEVLAHLLYAEPSPLTSINGTTLEGPRVVRIDGIAFRVGDPIALTSLLTPGGDRLPSEVEVSTKGLKGHMLVLALDCAQVCEDLDPVGEITVELASGKVIKKQLLYGIHVRAATDRGAIGAGARGEGLASLLLPLGSDTEVSKITLTAASTYAGLRLHGATAY